MQHNFFYKKIGNISDELLSDMQSDATFAIYKSTPDFSPNVLTISNFVSPKLIIKLFYELKDFFKHTGHVGTNYAKMNPISYLKEHSDFSSHERESSIYLKMIKLQIPIITNDKVGMMWAPTSEKFDVTSFVTGGIYIIDNVRKHSVVNLSNEYRYNLTSRFHIDSLVDTSLLD